MSEGIKINERIKAAIGRLEAGWPDQPHPSQGTAFLVTATHVLTAYHVVGDRDAFMANGSRIFSKEIWFTPSSSKELYAASVVDGCADGLGDWALLKLNKRCDIKPVPLADFEAIDQSKNSAFATWGFPEVAASAGSGVVADGYVKDWNAKYGDVAAIELHCEFARLC